jgi:glycosyltransferase involved in cell wall biosynthesis
MVLLSVIIPTYNSELTLERCLYSLASQTFKDFEICIIDGASIDKTVEICMNFRNSISNLRIISEPDLGVYDAMNKGISFSKGEWIYFLGSDDEIYSNDVFFNIFCNKSNLDNDVLYGSVNSKTLGSCYDGEFNTEKLYAKNICHQAIFLKRHVFERIGSYSLEYKIWSDYDHNIRWFCDARIRKKFIDNIIANYSDLGFSSLNEDLLFLSHKPLIFLRRGFFHLTYKTQMHVLYFAEERAKNVNLILFFVTKFIRKTFFLFNYFFLHNR